MDPTVAVVIPTFNPDKSLDEAIASVLKQSWQNVHLYVVDDGSASPPRLESHSRLTYFRRPNLGVSDTRNFAVSLGREPLVAFLDQDDAWHPDKIARQLALLDARSEASGCFAWARMIDEDGRDLGPAYGAYEHDIEDGRAYGGGVILSSLMVRRPEFIASGGFDPDLKITQDWDLLIKISRLGPVLACRDELVRYRVHANNTSRDFRRLANESDRLLRNLLNDGGDADRDLIQRARRDFSRLCTAKAIEHASNAARAGHFLQAVRSGAWAVRRRGAVAFPDIRLPKVNK